VDVKAGVGEVLVAVDHPGVEAALEQVTDAVVAAVESLRVQPVQSFHPV
jgi:hypothetical protein